MFNNTIVKGIGQTFATFATFSSLSIQRVKLALVGYGKMGQAVEAAALARGHNISHVINRERAQLFAQINKENTDAIIDFTHPLSVFGNMERLVPLGIPIVVGTTGWLHQMEELKAMAARHNTPMLYGSNFSIGVQIFFQVNQLLAKLMDRQPQYDCFIEERHHKHKADAPSGTALSLVEQILGAVKRKRSWVPAAEISHRAIALDELSVGFIRSGEIAGEHTVVYTSAVDTLELSHRAQSREGFALGAVVAAEWLQSREGFFNFSDIFLQDAQR